MRLSRRVVYREIMCYNKNINQASFWLGLQSLRLHSKLLQMNFKAGTGPSASQKLLVMQANCYLSDHTDWYIGEFKKLKKLYLGLNWKQALQPQKNYNARICLPCN